MRKNGLLISYLAGFAVLAIGMYLYPVLAVAVLFAYPLGALLFGYVTGDAVRAAFAGIFSYVFIILMVLLSIGVQGFDDIIISPFWFAGYHLTLAFLLGMIGWLSSNKGHLSRFLALLLAILWVLFFFSGIS